MAKVFKTDVEETGRAQTIMEEIRKLIPESKPSFDLEDCDKVLRVEHSSGEIKEQDIREILTNYGHSVEILP